MKKEIFISTSLNEARIAITENGELAELFIETPDQERMVGSVFMGKVQKIAQGMNAAFVDIGLKQDAFLHFSDVDSTLEESFVTDEDDDDDTVASQSDEPVSEAAAIALRLRKPDDTHGKTLPTFATKRSGTISINLQPQQTVIVQVVREAYSTKGVRVATKVALPGRYVVLLPFDNLIGVSRKISSIKERKRLRALAKSILPPGAGCIIRTASDGKSEEDLRRDWDYLLEQWNEIESNVKKASKPPALLFRDKNITGSVIRDLFTSDVMRVVVDSKKLFNEIVTYLQWSSPELSDKVFLYEGKKAIFEYFNIEKTIASTYARKVLVPGGGSIVLDQTEALFVVDVNSGRSTSEQEQEKVVTRTNLDAVRVIAQQLRLRDVGGIIVVDFIDMQLEENRKRVWNEMRRELSKDRAKTVCYPITQLGLMQLTRQRIRQNITERLSDECPTCNGVGRVQSPSLIVASIERWLRNFRAASREFGVQIIVHPTVAEYLLEGSVSRLSRLMIKHFVRIRLQQSEHCPPDKFHVYSLRHQKELTQDFVS